MALSALMGLLLAIVSIVGYFMASSALRESVDSELRTTISNEANELNGWLKEKKAFGVATTNHMTSLNGNMEVMQSETQMQGLMDSEITRRGQLLANQALVQSAADRLRLDKERRAMLQRIFRRSGIRYFDGRKTMAVTNTALSLACGQKMY